MYYIFPLQKKIFFLDKSGSFGSFALETTNNNQLIKKQRQ